MFLEKELLAADCALDSCNIDRLERNADVLGPSGGNEHVEHREEQQPSICRGTMLMQSLLITISVRHRIRTRHDGSLTWDMKT